MRLGDVNTKRHREIGLLYDTELLWLHNYYKTKLSLMIYHDTDAPENTIDGARFLELAMHTLAEIDIEYSSMFLGSLVAEQLMEDLTLWVENASIVELFNDSVIKVLEK